MNDEGSAPSKEDPANKWERMTSREEVLKLPHFMVMLGYVSRAYGLPKYGWRNKSLRYHYTDAVGLLGILTSHRLWATDTRFVNDPSEGRFLPETLLSLMEERVEGPSEQTVVNEIRSSLAHPRDASATFSISFCAHGDLLSQWRGYGSFGAGYAIGLEIHEVPHAQLGSLYDVCYGEQRLDIIARDLLEIYVTACKKRGEHMTKSLCEEGATLLRALAASFKHSAYEAEQESRIVLGYSKRQDYLFEREAPLQFRARGGDIVPYIPLALDLMKDSDLAPKLPIRQIIMGPGIDFARNRSSLNLLLEHNGYENVEIIASAVPLRS